MRPTPQELEEAGRLFGKVPGKDLPTGLQKTLANVGLRPGMSGDGFIDVTTAWLRDGQNRELSYEEVLAIWETANGVQETTVMTDNALGSAMMQAPEDSPNQNAEEVRIQSFLAEQRALYQAHLEKTGVSVRPPSFEEWLAALFVEQRAVLRTLWNKLVEYDMNNELEESAREIDQRNKASATLMDSNREWAEVLGIIEDVRHALGETEHD